MNNKRFLPLIFAGLFVTHAVYAVEWGKWSSDVSSSNSHADAPQTNENFDIIRNNVDTIDSTLNDSIKKQQTINAQQDTINENQASLNAQQGTINENQASLNAQQGTINENQASLNAQQGTINENQASLNTQQGAINQSLARSNAQIQNSLTQLKGDLNNLSNRVDKLNNRMKRGFASQAALSGLFQPYNIGKFNLSASLGGYESTNAIAMGSGYRFNENVAAKVGISTNTEVFKSVSYNAAVNFEW